MLTNTLKEVAFLPNLPDADDVAYYGSSLLLQAATQGVDTADDDTPGLVLTAQQIVNFRKYELAALELPVEARAVEAWLGYVEGGGPGLGASDFRKLFVAIRNHALGWAPLRREIRSSATQLQIFAGVMRDFKASAADIFDAIDVRFKGQPKDKPRTLKDLASAGYKFEYGTQLDLLVEPGAVARAQADYGAVLTDMKWDIGKQQSRTASLLSRLTRYTDVLNNEIKGAIAIKRRLVLNKQSDPLLQKLQRQIDERALEIQNKDTAYKAKTNEAIKRSFQWGPIAGIVIGVKADKLRKERNQLIKKQEADLEELGKTKTLQTALVSVLYRLQHLDIVVDDAGQALENLGHVWASLLLYIQESSQSAQSVTDLDSLMTLKRKFNRVCNPWLDVDDVSEKLLAAFDKADLEIKKHYAR